MRNDLCQLNHERIELRVENIKLKYKPTVSSAEEGMTLTQNLKSAMGEERVLKKQSNKWD